MTCPADNDNYWPDSSYFQANMKFDPCMKRVQVTIIIVILNNYLTVMVSNSTFD